MPDELDNTLSASRGQGPSPEFVAALRERLIAESKAQTLADVAPVTELELTPMKEQTMTTTRKMMIGLVAAAFLVVAGFAIIGTGSDEVTSADQPSETTTNPGAPSPDDLLGTWTSSFGPTWTFEADRIAVTGGAVSEFMLFATDTFIQITDDSGCPFGMYGWQIDEDVLTLTLINDECGGRNDALDGATFQRAD